jgi:hypothetical protein
LPLTAQVNLTHHYGGDVAFTTDFGSISIGGTSLYKPFWYKTGLQHPGLDYWSIKVQMSDSASRILQPSNPPSDFIPLLLRGETDNKECLLTFADVGNTMTWLVDGSGWYQNGHKVKPDCSDRWRTPLGYNSLSTVYVTNGFSQDMTALVMTHQYDTDTTYLYNFSAVLPAAGTKTSKYAMVEFFNGPTHPGFVIHPPCL